MLPWKILKIELNLVLKPTKKGRPGKASCCYQLLKKCQKRISSSGQMSAGWPGWVSVEGKVMYGSHCHLEYHLGAVAWVELSRLHDLCRLCWQCQMGMSVESITWSCIPKKYITLNHRGPSTTAARESSTMESLQNWMRLSLEYARDACCCPFCFCWSLPA